MNEEFDRDGTLDDEYFYEHYGRPSESGGTGNLKDGIIRLITVVVIVNLLLFLIEHT